MILFFIKKNFFDGWENIINILVPNLLTIATVVLTALGIMFWGSAPGMNNSFGQLLVVLTFYLFIFAAISLILIFTSAFANNAKKIADGTTASLSDYFSDLGAAFKNNYKFAFLTSFVIIACVVGVPIYIQLNSFYGVAFGFVLLLISIFVLLALQWYVPISVLLGGDFKKIFKKCFVVLFDNFGFSLFMAIYSLFLFACSVVMLLFLPGFCGILLGQINALRLRLYKYDWLDEHPSLKVVKERNNIPWDALIKEDEELLGKKSIRSLFLPWKSEKED